MISAIEVIRFRDYPIVDGPLPGIDVPKCGRRKPLVLDDLV
jgi:hypothetical protein